MNAAPVTRQWLNCPATEAHVKRLEQMKALATPDERQTYLARVRAKCGVFWSDYLADDFAALAKTKKRAA